MDIQQYFLDLGFSPSLVIFIISTLPVVELRGAIPVAINILDYPWLGAYFLAIAGNMLPVPFILQLLSWFTEKVRQYSWGAAFVEWLFARTQKRSGIIFKYRSIGLVMFVAVPLPLTGAWTGAIAAVLLGMGFHAALFSILTGVLIAGVIVTCLALLGWAGAFIAGLFLIGIFIFTRLESRP
jgi:uncharacterized membrane protein